MAKSPKSFKYDVVKLIEAVKGRPCLWDKTLENYKDRIERRTAWEEIFSIMEERYEEDMSWEEKRVTGEIILNKWTNVRDTFVKTLKTKMGKPKKKYLLHDHLKFLMKVIPEEERNIDYSSADEVATYMKQEVDLEEETPEMPSYSRRRSKRIDYSEDYTPPKKSKRSDGESKKYKPQDSEEDFGSLATGNEHIDFVEVKENDPRIMNEDEAFFASLLPTVVKYTEDERLEFRIEVLAIMKNIRNKKWSADD